MNAGPHPLVPVLPVLVLLMGATAVVASPEELRLEKRRLESVSRKHGKVARRSALLEDQIERLTEEKAASRERILELEKEIEILDRKIGESRSRSAALEEDLEEARTSFKAHFRDFTSRLHILHEMRSIPILGLILESRSLAEFMRLKEYHRVLTAYDLGRIEELEVLRGEIDTRRRAVQREIAAAEELVENRRGKNRELAENVRQSESIRKKLQAQRERLEEETRKLGSQKSSIEARIRKLEARRHRSLTRKARPGQDRQDQPRPGSLSWPVGPRREVVKAFSRKAGNRNPGIDLRIDGPTVVRAAQRGQVIHRGDLPAFGRVLMVDHGGEEERLITVYGNLDAIMVSMGQWVDRGEPVARIGSRSTEPRNSEVLNSEVLNSEVLHFEVRKDAVPQDPLVWMER